MSNPVSATPASGLGRRMTRGAAWVVGTRTAVRLLGVVGTIVLARLLTPADFGLIALATVVAAGLEQLGWFGFEVWLIRHPRPRRAHYDTAWTLTVLRGAVIALALFTASEAVAAYFEEPRLRDLLRVLALGALVQGAVNIGTVDFQRELAFHKEFVLFTAPKLLSLVVTVALAITVRTYWALAAGIIAHRLGQLVASYAMHPYRPRPSFAHWRELFGFSKWLLFGNWLGFIYLRADTFVLGKLAGPQGLGVYAVAKEIADLASSELLMPIRRVMLPAYSQLRDDRPRLERAFVDGFAVILFVGLPAATGLALVADPLVRLLLGAKWLAAVPLIEVLAWYAVASIAIANQSPLLVALGHVRTNTAIAAVGACLLLPALIAGTLHHGALGGAVAVSAVNWTMLVLSLAVTLRRLGMSPWTLLRHVWRVLVANTVMALAVHATAGVLADGPPAVGLLGCVAAGAVVYPGVCLGLWYLCGRPEGPERASVDLALRRDPVAGARER